MHVGESIDRKGQDMQPEPGSVTLGPWPAYNA